VPSEQTTVAPGGNTTVFDAGGRGLLLLKLMQPFNAKKISRIRTRMVILGSGALSQALSSNRRGGLGRAFESRLHDPQMAL
jgi:hypothetical protein